MPYQATNNSLIPFVMRLNEARKQKETVRRLITGGFGYGTKVWFDNEFDEKGNWNPPAFSSLPNWLRNMAGDDFFRRVYAVECIGHDCSNEDVKNLSNLNGVRQVMLYGPNNVTDVGIASLTKMTALEELTLYNTNVSESSLEHIKKLRNLRVLVLHGTHVTDSGLEHITELANLESLSLAIRKLATLQSSIWCIQRIFVNSGLAELASQPKVRRRFRRRCQCVRFTSTTSGIHGNAMCKDRARPIRPCLDD